MIATVLAMALVYGQPDYVMTAGLGIMLNHAHWCEEKLQEEEVHSKTRAHCEYIIREAERRLKEWEDED